MANELTIIEEIDKKLQMSNGNVFPLTPTHRKELRQLKSRNVGDLRTQLRVIKDAKKEEYYIKHKVKVEKEIQKKISLLNNLNKDWEERLALIINIIQKRKELEEKNKKVIEEIGIYHDYGNISSLNIDYIKKECREIKVDVPKISYRILSKEFKEKFSDDFNNFDEMIDKLNTSYEEAINFGDLSIVKELYYKMKDADKFLEKIRKLEV